ncbi:MAG TPA: DNA gyrase inhibitor YacG [Sphingomonadaceae bacterium]|jgi:endogenous inhibitor of DNA gyrase (YacG/DUF329 family)|nr:DNA gyrase inhibitor YacG [Sphingomonadaceae bacterium]
MSQPNTPDARTEPPARRARGSGCPLCGKPPVAKAAPFCSPGCRDRDLLAWLGDDYRVPGPPLDEETLSGADGSAPDVSGLDRDG